MLLRVKHRFQIRARSPKIDLGLDRVLEKIFRKVGGQLAIFT